MSDVTVVIPTRGDPVYLAEALASVRDASEVIVVEDGTRNVTKRATSGARLIQLSHVGRSAARNAGVAAASSPVVAFLDADDVAFPGRFERQLEALEDAPETALCFGPVAAIGPDSKPLPAESAAERERFERLLERGPSYESLLVDCPIYTSATVVRRDLFLAAGGYDRALDAYEDLDLYLRLARDHGLAACAGPPVAGHRRHEGNTSSDYLYAGALRVADKHLPTAVGEARKLLLERRLDSLWGLGDFRAARAQALRSLLDEPLLLRNPRFAKRLAASLLPLGALRARRSA